MPYDNLSKEFFFADAVMQPVEFLRLGTFTDSRGQQVDITDDFLDTVVATFKARAAGQDVPIDIDHEHGQAAGWVKEVWRAGDRLLASVDWNKVGEELVSGRVYRYLSASIDSAGKVLKSISLVNFPAVKGLKPVELSEGGYTMEEDRRPLMTRIMTAVQGVLEGLKIGGEVISAADNLVVPDSYIDTSINLQEDSMTQQEESELRETVRQELLAEMKADQKTRADMRAEVRAEAMVELREEIDRHRELTQFAEKICGGDVGLSAKPEILVELMTGMDDAQLKSFQEVLTAKVVDFKELGSSRAGSAGKAALDAPYKEQVAEWIAAGRDLTEWFTLNADVVGSADQYELSGFVSEEE